MSSLVQGYEYDIFISYRQKDNKYDGWVTEFVDNLKRELEATFKEEVSVYFDINPHDGILETYNVDASLKEKLKCLVFIPIISQTYCDPKSFAWQNEFVAFNKMALSDAFGREVKLSNGNIASRILPVKIHELDPEDSMLLELELGATLRSIDFIYRESGVNRPLNPRDNKYDNQNKTEYRNQVNKVANAVKEIIASLKEPGIKNIQSAIPKKPEKLKTERTLKKNISSKIILAVISSIILILIAVLSIKNQIPPASPDPPGTSKSKTGSFENSIAVLYFDNISSEPDQDYFSDGMTDEIIAHLSLIKGLRVISRTSVLQYKGKDKVNIREIAKQLNVATVLEGSVRKAGNKLRITAELIDANNDQHIWTEIYDRDLVDVFKIQSDIAHSIAEKFKIRISSEANSRIESIPTNDIKAYDLYLQAKAIPVTWGFGIGKDIGGIENAVRLLKEAIKLDPDFSQAYAVWSQIYSELTDAIKIDSAIILAREAILRNPGLPDGYIALSKTQDLNNSLKTLRNLCTVDSISGLLGIGKAYLNNAEFPSAVQSYSQVIKLDPNLYNSYLGIADVYYHMAQQDSVDKYLALANKYAPNSKDILEFSVRKEQFSGNTKAEIAAAKKYYTDDTLNFNNVIAISYLIARDWKSAEKFYLKTTYRDMDWGLIKIKTGKIDSGKMILRKSLSYRGENGWSGDLSRIHAVLGNKAKAISEFRKLLASGFHDLVWMRNDPYWDELREDDQFKRLMDEVEQRNARMLQQIRENKYSAFKPGNDN